MNKVALVVGGGNGLGKASSIALNEQGFRIAVADLDLLAAEKVKTSLHGGGNGSFHVDVTSEQSVVELFDRVEGSIGPVAVLANFAGLLIASDGKRVGLKNTSLDEWEQTFAVNVRGCFLLVREMLRRRAVNPIPGSRIITISSLAGQVGGIRGSAAYSAAKGAVITLTKTAAREGGPIQLTANAIAPGMIETAMMRLVLPIESEADAIAAVPIGRVGRPEEIAAAVVFLASEGSSYMTGNTLDINGGLNLR